MQDFVHNALSDHIDTSFRQDWGNTDLRTALGWSRMAGLLRNAAVANAALM